MYALIYVYTHELESRTTGALAPSRVAHLPPPHFHTYMYALVHMYTLTNWSHGLQVPLHLVALPIYLRPILTPI